MLTFLDESAWLCVAGCFAPCGLGCHQLMDQACLHASEGAGSGLLNGWPGELMHNFLPPTNPSTHLVCLHCALGAGCPTSGLDVGSWASGVLHPLLVDMLGGARICDTNNW